MSGPDGLLRDPESCLRQTTATDSDGLAADKVGDGARGRAATSDPSSIRASGNSLTTHDHVLVQTLKGHIPLPIQKTSTAVWAYLTGPDPPRPWKIRPVLPRLQQLPPRLVDSVCPRQWQRILVLFLFYVCWIATFGAVLHKSAVADDVNGYGQPIQLQCGGVFW